MRIAENEGALVANEDAAADRQNAETPASSGEERGAIMAPKLFNRYRRFAGLPPLPAIAAPEGPVTRPREEVPATDATPFDRYRRFTGLSPRPAIKNASAPAEEASQTASEECVVPCIHSLQPDQDNPRIAIITYDDWESTGAIRSIIRKEGVETIANAQAVGVRFMIRATFRTVDQCISVIMKYMRWTYEDEEEEDDQPFTTHSRPETTSGPNTIPCPVLAIFFSCRGMGATAGARDGRPLK